MMAVFFLHIKRKIICIPLGVMWREHRWFWQSFHKITPFSNKNNGYK